jgi:hypothetical protein
MAEWKDVPHVIIIYNCEDDTVCEACRKIAGEYTNINEVPELPYSDCSCEFGCRC